MIISTLPIMFHQQKTGRRFKNTKAGAGIVRMPSRSAWILLFFMLSPFYAIKASAQEPPSSGSLELWYRQPAAAWTDALPLGNGHIGAMIYGGIDTDHIQFNEATLWSGRPRNYQHPGASAYLEPIRKLLTEGRQREAEELATAHFMGIKDPDPARYQVRKEQWLSEVRKNIAPSTMDFDDHECKVMTLPQTNGWESAGLQGLDGAVWFRVSFDLPEKLENKNLYLDLGRIRDVDYTYVNGTLVGSSEGISTKRHYLVKASLLKPGKNMIAVQVINYFDKGGFTGVKGDHRIFVLYPVNEQPKDGVSLGLRWQYQIQNDHPPSYPQYEASYQPFGDLNLFFPHAGKITGYRRSLDLSRAIAQVSYKCNGVPFKRQYWVSAKDRIMAIHVTAGKNGQINFSAGLSSVHKLSHVLKIDRHTIALRVHVKDGALYGYCYLKVKTQGAEASVHVEAERLVIGHADAATLYLTAATNFKTFKDVSGKPAALCIRQFAAAEGRSYEKLRSDHEHQYQSLFNRFQIDFGKEQNDALPTDQRILAFSDRTDPALIALYVQYARYLLISCSPPGARAANLQGIWNNLLTPPWGSKYTTNINLEMNYWPAEVLNLSPCTQPLFHLIKVVSGTGRLTAKAQYNAPGWIEHHNTDIWGATAPIDAATNGIWVGGAAWLCHHLWEHYLFTGDRVFLLDTAYPIMKSAALFYNHFLTRDPKTGYLISSPSNSPEHGGLVAGPAMDHQLIRDLFKNCMAAESVLQTDTRLGNTLLQKYKQIQPNQVGRFGQLQEWVQDKDDTADTHRHVSHLWGVYPGTDITWKDPKMMKAAMQSLVYRGDGGTGWSLAWKVNLWARFKDGDHALKLLDELLRPAEGASGAERGGVYHNMFDAHPPFQIDGNFGGAAGVAEMLVQSQDGCIELLPALPAGLSTGHVSGICARGNFVLDMSWKNGSLEEVAVHCHITGPCRLHYKNKSIEFRARKGITYSFNSQLEKQ